MKLKKSMKLIATATASSIVVAGITSCSAEDKDVDGNAADIRQKDSDSAGQKVHRFQFKINEIQGSADVTRCGTQCVSREK